MDVPIIRRDVAMILTNNGVIFFLMLSFISISMPIYLWIFLKTCELSHITG